MYLSLLHNESCEIEARRIDPYGPQEMAIQLIEHFADTTRVSPAGPAELSQFD